MFLAFLDYQLRDSQCLKFDHIYEFPPLWSFIPSVLHLFSWLIMDFTDDEAVQCSNRFVFSKYVKFQSFVQLELQMYLKANVNAMKVRTRRKLPSKLQTCPVDTNPVTKLAPNAKELINHNWARFKIFLCSRFPLLIIGQLLKAAITNYFFLTKLEKGTVHKWHHHFRGGLPTLYLEYIVYSQ